ncbi:hypothetical protein D3C80_2196700 [compost metagenome]
MRDALYGAALGLGAADLAPLAVVGVLGDMAFVVLVREDLATGIVGVAGIAGCTVGA